MKKILLTLILGVVLLVSCGVVVDLLRILFLPENQSKLQDFLQEGSIPAISTYNYNIQDDITEISFSKFLDIINYYY